MAVGSILSPEHCSLSPVQCRYIHGEEAPKYQSVRKRSSKDRYPPEMAFVRTGHRDVFDTCQELEGYFQHATYIFVFKTANEEKEVRAFLFFIIAIQNYWKFRIVYPFPGELYNN